VVAAEESVISMEMMIVMRVVTFIVHVF
jgi:hypothetical protein